MSIKINCNTDVVARLKVNSDFVPALGPFTFPSPYDTQATRITNESYGLIEPIGYPYWNNINNHEGQPNLLVFVGRTNNSPLLFGVDKNSLEVVLLKELTLNGTAERWYFSKVQPNIIYAELVNSQLIRYDVTNDNIEVVFDLADHGYPDHIVWQSYTSYDDNVHSATLKDTSYTPLGAVIYRESNKYFQFYPARDLFDECQIDKSGKWLVIKEGNYNRIINIDNNSENIITNEQGALGHSDNGFNYMIGEDDMYSEPGAMRLWNFDLLNSKIIYHMTEWDTMARHISHCNARNEGPDNQTAIISSAHRNNNLSRANEIVRATLNGSLDAEVLAPNLTDLNAMPALSDYAKLPKANCDVTGEYIVWSTNMDNGRLDVLLLKAPL